MKLHDCTTLSTALDGALPTAFRIFAAGKIDTKKGVFLFDAKAAASVMAEYRLHGSELMVDYDHASLGAGIDPALSGKAAAWFGLELRNGGELWAVNVRWCAPAADALRRKEWRYMSPAFSTEPGSNRITALLNVALTNLPASRRLEPLVAASALAASKAPPKPTYAGPGHFTVQKPMPIVGPFGLSSEQVAICREMGVELAAFANAAAARDRQRGR